MTAKELFQAGRIDEAIETLGIELRSNPTDAQRRTFLFELLCFAGNYDRAEKQLDVLGSTMGTRRDFEAMVQLYAGGLHPIVDSVFPLSQVALAHRRMEEGQQFGKIVLRIPG